MPLLNSDEKLDIKSLLFLTISFTCQKKFFFPHRQNYYTKSIRRLKLNILKTAIILLRTILSSVYSYPPLLYIKKLRKECSSSNEFSPEIHAYTTLALFVFALDSSVSRRKLKRGTVKLGG